MRLYTFNNLYISQIQVGIQTAHVVHDLFLKYPQRKAGDHPGNYLWDWATNHKTMILLNGGFADTLRTIIANFEYRENPYPWVAFHEAKDSLDGALTSVGIVLPEKIYLLSKQLRGPTAEETREDIWGGGLAFIEGLNKPGEPYIPQPVTPYELTLAEELNKYSLA